MAEDKSPNKKIALGMSEISGSDPQDQLSKWFLRFADQAGDSRLYRHLAIQIAQDQELLTLAKFCNPSQPAPNLFLAAVHYTLMLHPKEALAEFYPSLGGRFQETSEMFNCFKRFCKKFESDIIELLKTKLVQTNEVQRCAVLLPALGLISEKLNREKIALVDVGSSGGLNLLMDKIRIIYSNGMALGPSESSLKLLCESRGTDVPEFLPPIIASRIGIDLNPVNLSDLKERNWNLALIWPDQTERIERVLSALEILNQTEINFKRGNANEVLHKIVDAIPADQSICIMHSFVLNQFSEDDREKFDKLLSEISNKREIWRISLEWIATETPELVITNYSSGKKNNSLLLARCQGHGQWVQWVV